MEDLPLGRIAALVPEFAVNDLPLGRTLVDITKADYISSLYIYLFIFEVLGRVNISGHWRAMAPVMNDDNDGQMIFGDLVCLKLPNISLTGEEKPRNKPHSGNLSRPGI